MVVSSSDLTIVVLTRDRVDLLKKALLSVFEHQLKAPPVIVSNNSTREYPEMAELQRQYGFSYIRQSGRLTVTEHHNACLRLATTRWVWLLHDDDELCPGAVAGVEACLKDCENVGIVVGGVNEITYEGEVKSHWVPTAKGVLRGDAALLELGSDWRVHVVPARFFGHVRALRLEDIGILPGTHPISPLHARWPMSTGSDFIRRLLADPDMEHIKCRTQRPMSRYSGGFPSTACR